MKQLTINSAKEILLGHRKYCCYVQQYGREMIEAMDFMNESDRPFIRNSEEEEYKEISLSRLEELMCESNNFQYFNNDEFYDDGIIDDAARKLGKRIPGTFGENLDCRDYFSFMFDTDDRNRWYVIFPYQWPSPDPNYDVVGTCIADYYDDKEAAVNKILSLSHNPDIKGEIVRHMDPTSTMG